MRMWSRSVANGSQRRLIEPRWPWAVEVREGRARSAVGGDAFAQSQVGLSKREMGNDVFFLPLGWVQL